MHTIHADHIDKAVGFNPRIRTPDRKESQASARQTDALTLVTASRVPMFHGWKVMMQIRGITT